MLTEAERLGMLGRRTQRGSSGQRYHPLVREFLESRLRRDFGLDGVDELHLTVAQWAEPSDWRTSAHHFAACRRWPDLERVLEQGVETIVAVGAFAIAAEYIARMPAETPASATAEVVLSRLASLVGDVEQVMAHARRAAELDPEADSVINNLIASSYLSGDLEVGLDLADKLASAGKSSLMREVGHAASVSIRSSLDFELSAAIRLMEDLAQRSRDNGHLHFEGISLLHAALMYRAQGRTSQLLAAASQAIDSLASSSSGNELASAVFIKAWGLAFDGDLLAARRLVRETGVNLHHSSRAEFLIEFAELESQFGDETSASRLIGETEALAVPESFAEAAKLVRAHLHIRKQDLAAAEREMETATIDRPTSSPGHKSQVLAMRAMIAALAQSSNAEKIALDATTFADHQQAHLWRELASLSSAAVHGQLGPALIGLPSHLAGVMAIASELILAHLGDLSEEAAAIVREEAVIRPDRWRPALRRAIADHRNASRLSAARLLDLVGDQGDVALLRAIAREPGRGGTDRQLGRTLARRLAPRALINDLGRVVIRLGSTEIGGGDIRRKVLALLCFLLTRPKFAATREEVMDAMWPEMDPTAAMNSLNQTLYFLRRVFEPAYSEETTAGYVHQESDVVWLDGVLIQSRSAMCNQRIEEYAKDPNPETVEHLSEEYSGRFALDFAYEDWASDFREWLHVAYLHVIESSIRDDIKSGHFERGLDLARRALELDPRLDTLELSLLRLLKSAGAHSAAAEQYGRYAHLLKEDLGVDAPPMETL